MTILETNFGRHVECDVTDQVGRVGYLRVEERDGREEGMEIEVIRAVENWCCFMGDLAADEENLRLESGMEAEKEAAAVRALLVGVAFGIRGSDNVKAWADEQEFVDGEPDFCREVEEWE